MNLPHDVVSLPSKGKFYKNKKSSIKVGYLTANDENILMSPNIISAIILVHDRRFLDKERIQIMDPAGEWRDVSIVCYRHEIPFCRQHGGVTVCYKDSGENRFHETFSISTWKTMRVRVPIDQPVAGNETGLDGCGRSTVEVSG